MAGLDPQMEDLVEPVFTMLAVPTVCFLLCVERLARELLEL